MTYLTDGLGAGFACYLLVFLVMVWLKKGPDSIPISKELLAFCFSAIWVGVFAFLGLTRKSYGRKMRFLKKLRDKGFISPIQYEVEKQYIMGWYTTGPYGLRPASLDEAAPPPELTTLDMPEPADSADDSSRRGLTSGAAAESSQVPHDDADPDTG
jgi:hypothetical protein